MTARTIDPDSRRRPARAAVTLVLVMVAVLLAAGCIGWLGGKYNHDQNVLITKMNPEGIVVWTKLIDTGKYDYALDFIETSDGGFIVVGGTSRIVCGNFNPPSPETPRLTRLSSSGDILWERDYDMRINAVIQNRDGSFAAVSDRGVILDLDPNGTVVNERIPGIHREGNNEWEYINTFTGLKDGGYLLAGQTIGKIDPLGNISWQQSDNQSIDTAFSIAEMKDKQGYLVLVFYYEGAEVPGAEVLHLDLDGSIIRANHISGFGYPPKPSIHQTSEGFSIVLNKPFMAYHFDRNGILTDNVTLNNVTIDMGNIVVPSEDGGFSDIANIGPGDLTKVTKLNPDGTIAWVKTSKCSEKGCPKLFGDILTTQDGGYAMMSPIEKQNAC
jgi:hypothetical protein